jgi:superfamily II DNA or RNA helicase
VSAVVVSAVRSCHSRHIRIAGKPSGLAAATKRSPIVLTERRDHLEYLQDRFSRFVRNLVVLRGGMSAVERRVSENALRVADNQERLILATGRYIGEGFDDHRLNTLFLTMPISWKGTLPQYVGRLHRQHDRKDGGSRRRLCR